MALRYVLSASAGTNGADPGSWSPSTIPALVGDLMLWVHYGRATGGNETFAYPGGWNEVFNSVTANYGHLAAAWRVCASGDTTYQGTLTNYTSGTTGESIIHAMIALRGAHPTAPVGSYTASLSTWASSTTLGSIAAPSSATLAPGDGVVVIGARFENVLTSTLLTGDNLTWEKLNPDAGFNTNSGSDAGGAIHCGWNRTNVNQTITAKSITTTGTAQVGAGRMLTIVHRPDVDLIGAGMIPFAY